MDTDAVKIEIKVSGATEAMSAGILSYFMIDLSKPGFLSLIKCDCRQGYEELNVNDDNTEMTVVFPKKKK